MKKLVPVLLLTLIALFSLQSCSNSDEKTPVASELQVSPEKVSVKAEGGTVQITYEIANPKEGSAIEATPEKPWLHSVNYSTKGKIVLTADANKTYDPRSCNVLVSYEDAPSVTVVVTQEAAAAPIKISISDVSTTLANVFWAPDDASMTYTLGVMPKSELDAYASSEEFMEKDIERLQKEAGDWGLEFLLYTGGQSFKKSELKENSEYIAYAYGLNADGKFTTGLIKKEFSTSNWVDCTFKLEVADITLNTATFNITPSKDDINYYVAYVEKQIFHDDFGDSDTELRAGAINQIRTKIALSGGAAKWLDFTHKGKVSLPVSQLFPGTEHYCFVFGLDEEGSPTTLLSKQSFTTQAETVTDNCTFGINFVNITSSLIDVEITPTNASTRYYASFLKKSDFDKYSPEQNASLKIMEENGWPIDWATDKKIHSGKQTLNSRYDLAVAPFDAETEYTFFIFGVSLDGKRTTIVAHQSVKTTAPKTSNMTIGIGVSDIANTSCKLSFTPSVDNELYVTAVIPYETAQYYPDDADLMNAVVLGMGELIGPSSVSGKQERSCDVDMLGNFLLPGTRYVVMAFGYMGGVTTGLFKEEFTTTGSAPEWPEWPE